MSGKLLDASVPKAQMYNKFPITQTTTKWAYTNVVINGIKGIDSARKFLLKFENEYRVSSVTLGELLFGAEKSRFPKRIKAHIFRSATLWE